MEYMRNPGSARSGNGSFSSYPMVGYAFVQPQHLGKVYPPKRALAAGTIFPELNIPAHDYTRGIRHER
ncbi:MAG: spore coat associated protein CotJA [Oscillospiraceae bacterium]|nr:spore coat associated protein CotJA [Oscillospiraceae bacterium]